MTGQTFVVFHTAADDSYMNSTANFRGADAGAEFVDIYFQSATSTLTAGYDKVRVTCTNGEEDRAIEQIASAMGGVKAGGFVVIADDVNSVYAGQNVLACGAITLASQTQTRAHETLITTEALTNADSGKVFFLDLLAGFTVTLPSAADAGAGWYCDFIVKTVTTSNEYVITEKASADTNKLCAIGLEAATTGAQLSNAGFTTCTFDATPTLGDKLHVICDGAFFYITSIVAADNDLVFA